MLEELLRRNRKAFWGRAAEEETVLAREEKPLPPMEMPARTAEEMRLDPLREPEWTEIAVAIPALPAEIAYPAGRGEQAEPEEMGDVLEQVSRRISWRSRMLPQDME